VRKGRHTRGADHGWPVACTGLLGSKVHMGRRQEHVVGVTLPGPLCMRARLLVPDAVFTRLRVKASDGSFVPHPVFLLHMQTTLSGPWRTIPIDKHLLAYQALTPKMNCCSSKPVPKHTHGRFRLHSAEICHILILAVHARMLKPLQQREHSLAIQAFTAGLAVAADKQGLHAAHMPTQQAPGELGMPPFPLDEQLLRCLNPGAGMQELSQFTTYDWSSIITCSSRSMLSPHCCFMVPSIRHL